MTSSVCPACRVAVVPGYVRCPKCHSPLPRFVRNSGSPVGGTAVKIAGGSPLIAVAVGVAIAVGFITYFSLRKRHAAPAAAEPHTVANTVAPDEPNAPNGPTSSLLPPTTSTQAKTPTPEPLAADLERSLRRARLWATVTVVGDHLDVRSGSCGEPQMRPALESVASSFKAAGLTKLRCIEQSGTVAFSRDL